MPVSIVVLGAGYAGMIAAIRTKRKAPPETEVVLISGRTEFVERIRLHQHATMSTAERPSIPQLLEGTGVQFIQGHVERFDAVAHTVHLTDGRVVAYTLLVYALGSVTDDSVIPGLREHALTLEPDRVLNVVAERTESNGAIVVIGGGLTAIETATEIASEFPSRRVTLLTAGSIDQGLTAGGANHLRKTFSRMGITVIEHEQALEVRADGVRTSSGILPFDLCFWAGGFRGNALARHSGLRVNAKDQLRVDGTLRSFDHPDVYAAGDGAFVSEHIGSPLHMACKTAMPMGAHVADNIAARLAGRQESVFSFRDTGICVSLGRSNGLVQVRRPDGSAWFAVTGRTAAWIKERVCRYTVSSIESERAGRSYRWLQGTPARTTSGEARVRET